MITDIYGGEYSFGRAREGWLAPSPSLLRVRTSYERRRDGRWEGGWLIKRYIELLGEENKVKDERGISE
jgi:hypothetical protein